MAKEWSNGGGGGGKRRGGGSRGSNNTDGNNNNNNNKNANTTASNYNAATNNRGGRRKQNQNAQRTTNQPSIKVSTGGSQRPANARNMTGANAATTTKTRSAANTSTSTSTATTTNVNTNDNTNTNVNVEKETVPTKVEVKTIIPASYAAAASKSSGDDHNQQHNQQQQQSEAQKPQTQNQSLGNTKLADSTILASNYVPEYLKEVLYLPVQHGYQARKLPDMLDHCNRTYYEMVPHPFQIPQPPVLPLPTREVAMVPLDPFFALRPEVKQRRSLLLLSSSSSSKSTTTAAAITTTTTTQTPPPTETITVQPTEQQQQQQHAARYIIPKLENAKGRNDYLHTFRLLLQEEFEEKMMLYERYTQFQSTVNVHPKAAARATLHIPGLSNTRPSLEPGDEVLLRPQPLRAVKQLQANGGGGGGGGPATNSYYYSNHETTMNMANSPMVEVHAQVVNVVRGTWKNKGKQQKAKMTDDKVVITWLEPHFNQMLQLNHQLVSVRFLPSTITLQRTLEALKWIERLHPAVAQQLLFPTEIPHLPISAGNDGDMNDLMLAHAPTDVADSNSNNSNSNSNKKISTTIPTVNGTDAPTTTIAAVAAPVGPKLNEKQSRFVHMVLKRTRYPSRGIVRPPMILTGPAGTGKTKALLTSIIRTLQQQDATTTAASIQNGNGNSSTTNHPQRLPKKHILVCAPSHTACDVITRRLSKSLSAQQLFRLYPSSRSIEMVPAELLPYVRMKPNDETEFILPPTQELLAFEVIVCTCSDAHILTLAGLTNSRLRMRRQQLQEYALTILQAGNMQISGEIVGAGDPHFTHLFIDEAAQATEPESLIPISVVVDDFPSAIKVEIALAGDPRQLSPDVYSPLAAGDLQKSLLERLLRLPEIGGRSHMMGPPTGESWTSIGELIEYSFQKKEDHDHLSVFLTTSYRGHPSFLMMPSKLFYFDKLRSAHPFSDSTDSKWCNALRKLEAASSIVNPKAEKQDSWPIHFRGVVGKDQSTAVETFLGSNSWSNPVEANEIVGIVQTLVTEGISTASIGIMGAFRGQVILIRRLLRAKGLGAVNVGIVEDYQAVERDVIIVSLTRSNSAFLNADMEQRVGLFQQTKRMNVALTRAENLLVVVGDPAMMEQDEVWKQWLEFCHHHGFWYGTKSEKSSIS